MIAKTASANWRACEGLSPYQHSGSRLRPRASSPCASIRFGQGGERGSYSVITRAPFTPRVQPAEAGRFLEDNILPHFELIALSADDYKAVLRSCTNAGLIGGVVFDALHLRGARRRTAIAFYTFNVKDFRSLAPEDLADRIAGLRPAMSAFSRHSAR
jgi:hypothetical protein